MSIAYRLSQAGNMTVQDNAPQNRAAGPLWIDALSPTEEEMAELNALAGFELPDRLDINEIELSNRLYKENGALVMVANLLPKNSNPLVPPRPVAFILRRNLLLTIRYYEFYSFERVAKEPLSEDQECTPLAVLCRILEEVVGDRADNLELSMRQMETLASQLFANPLTSSNRDVSRNRELDEALRAIAKMGESVSNIRESITTLQRVVNFAATHVPEPWLGEQRSILNSLRTDLAALSDEAAFFMSKLSFNLDATLGLVNIEENKIIRLLSVVTLLLSPPTLIAGIYGMNFHIMPELTWEMGYIFSLGLMISTAVASIWYLKRKRWL